MGYCVDMTINNLFIPLEKVNDALKAINALHNLQTMKDNQCGGGTFQGGKQTNWSYSWVDNPPTGGFKSLEEALDAWRYTASNQDGNCVVEYFNGEKLGDDTTIWEALAPFVNPKAEIACRGEDGALWKWVFNNGKFKELSGTVTYR